MDGTQPLGIYVFATLLWVIPCCFLFAGWQVFESQLPAWRSSCLRAAFVIATCATALSLISLFSYLHNGGGIHGSQTSPGIWKALGPASSGLAIVSVLAGVIGRSKRTLLLLGWFIAIVAADYVALRLAVD